MAKYKWSDIVPSSNHGGTLQKGGAVVGPVMKPNARRPGRNNDPGTKESIDGGRQPAENERQYRVICLNDECQYDVTLVESEKPRREHWNHNQVPGHDAIMRRVDRGGSGGGA